MCEVGVSEDVCREEFVCVSDALDDGLQLFDDVGDGLVMLEVVLYSDAKEWCVCVLYEGGCLYHELDWFW